jgi:hypothetical protein
MVADHAVAQLKERGDPWRLNEEALRRSGRQRRASLELGRLLIGSPASGTEGIPRPPSPAFRS